MFDYADDDDHGDVPLLDHLLESPLLTRCYYYSLDRHLSDLHLQMTVSMSPVGRKTLRKEIYVYYLRFALSTHDGEGVSCQSKLKWECASRSLLCLCMLMIMMFLLNRRG